MADAPRITAQQTMDAGEDITIVDVRNPQAWSQSGTMMPGAIRVPVQEWQQHLPRIPKDRPVDLRPLPGVSPSCTPAFLLGLSRRDIPSAAHHFLGRL